MLNRENISWAQIGVEAVAIVASILLAFAIDAWWDERQLRVEEGEILLGLQQEFAQKREILEEYRAMNDRALIAMVELLQASHRGSWDDAGLEFGTALGRVLTPATADLPNGVLAALISSGRLEIVSSKALRERLAAWSGVYDELRDDEINNAGLIFDLAIPYLARTGVPMSQSFSAIERTGAPRRSIMDQPDVLSRLLTDPEFLSILEIRYGLALHTQEEFGAALAAVDAILMELGHESGQEFD